jgi:hypothetical protein
LNGEPILAHPIGALGRTWRWCRRKPVVASLTAAVVLLLLAFAIGGPIVASQQRALAEKNRRLSYASSMSAAWQAWDIGNMGRCSGLLDQQRPRPGQTDLREFTWRYLWNLYQPARDTPVATNIVSVFRLATSPDGSRLAVTGPTGSVTLWDVATRECLCRFSTGQRFDGEVAFSPNGRLLVTHAGTNNS